MLRNGPHISCDVMVQRKGEVFLPFFFYLPELSSVQTLVSWFARNAPVNVMSVLSLPKSRESLALRQVVQIC